MQEPINEVAVQLEVLNKLLEEGLDEMVLMRAALEKFVEEGITIYMHEGGEEQKN